MTLALGIGANAAIFTRGRRGSAAAASLRGRRPARHDRRPLGDGGSPDNVGFATYEDLRDRNRTFASIAAVRSWQPTLVRRRCRPNASRPCGSPRTTSRCSACAPALGRGFPARGGSSGYLARPAVERRPVAPELRRRPVGVGRVVRLNGRSFRIVGVMPRDFRTSRLGALLQAGGVLGAGRVRPEPGLRVPKLPAPEGHRPTGAGRDGRAGERGPRSASGVFSRPSTRRTIRPAAWKPYLSRGS